MKIKRIRRGAWWGAWGGVSWSARCAYRLWGVPDGRNDLVGFRCCFPPLFVKINKERLETDS